jgi:EmrB/QacA subfamily drug resistance transporter
MHQETYTLTIPSNLPLEPATEEIVEKPTEQKVPIEQPNKYKWLSLFVLALAVSIVVIDGTIMNVAQKYVIDDLDTDIKTIQWAFTAYSLTLAALTILGGRLGDLYGRKKMFVTGAVIFAFGSLITALSKDSATLILGWSIIEGIGAALMLPASSALLVSNFEGKERGIAFGIYGAMAGVASSFGPILGGYFATTIGWRWAFGINVVVAAILCAGAMVVRDRRDLYPNKIYLDWGGVILSSLALVSIVYGIIESSTYGWLQAKKPYNFFGTLIDSPVSITVWAVLFGIFMLEIFIFWERKVAARGDDPLVRLDIFKNREFTFGIGVLATLFAGFAGFITYGAVFFFLVVKGMSAFEAGLALIPFSLASFILAPISSKIAEKIGNRNLVVMGLSINLLGNYLTYKALAYSATAPDFILAFVVTGIGFGMLAAQLNNIVLSSVSLSEAGVASGINGTLREVARSLGIAIIGAGFIATLSTQAISNIKAQADADIPQALKNSIVSGLEKNGFDISGGATKTDFEILSEAEARGIPINIPEARSEYITNYRKVEDNVKTEIGKAVTAASKQAIVYTIVFNILAIGLAFGLRDNRKDLLKS